MRYLGFVFLFFSTFTLAQPTPSSLARLGQEYLTAQNDEDRLSKVEVFADSLWDFISIESNYGNRLLEVRNLSVQLPEDESFALYTWTVPLRDGTFKFFGFLWNPEWEDQKRLVLEDLGTSEDSPYRWLRGGEFVGGLCYDILTTKHRGKKHYTLLMFRPGRIYHTKMIDAIELGNKSYKVHFGSRIFNIRENGDERYKRKPYRIWFRYNSSVTAAVRWDARHRGIICDHLAPSKPNLVEKWFAYGPDFSYDRIQWRRGQWQLDEAYPLVRNIEQAPENGNIPTSLGPRK